MEPSYWHRQTIDKPLYADLLWSRPENKLHAGKLGIIGGNAHGFAVPAACFAASEQAGVGTARVLLPDSLRKTVGRVFLAGEYAPSTPSGSFSQRALAEFLELGLWADGMLLAGDLGRNSETAIVLEQFVTKYTGQLTITKDAADYFTGAPLPLINRPNTLAVLSFGQLQKLATHMHFPQAFTSDMDLLRAIDALHSLTGLYPLQIITRHQGSYLVAVNGEVSTTKQSDETLIWRAATATKAAVWWLQNPTKPFDALTTSIIAT